MRLFLKRHAQKERFPPFTRTWIKQKGALSSYKREKNNSEKKGYWPGPDIMGKLCGQTLSAPVLGTLYFGVTRWRAGPVRVGCLPCMCHVHPRACSLEFGGTFQRG